VQYGGQTPLKLAKALKAHGVNIIGTTPDMIDRAEDRARFQAMLQELKLQQPPNCIAFNTEEALRSAQTLGYPLVVRPSYVLGGRAMEIVHEQSELEYYMQHAVKVSENAPILLDRFLNDAIEIDIDAVSDGQNILIGGVMEHIEEAGVHSGDSACSLPPYRLSLEMQNTLRKQTKAMAKALQVVGLMNVQFAVQNNNVYVLEVNPRASRTVPFVSKATAIPLAKIAARCMVGQSLIAQNAIDEVIPDFFAVKEAVFPFIKFPGVDTILGPEMKSTGEVMGIGKTFAEAFIKSQMAAGERLPRQGTVFMSVRNQDKSAVVEMARILTALNFALVATKGTANVIRTAGMKVRTVNKVQEGTPHIVDMIKNNEIVLVFNTVEVQRSTIQDSYSIRNAALQGKIPLFTTITGARAACLGMRDFAGMSVYALQSLHQTL
jgi:carbamoyl-phosphate synthase large subunit